MSYKDAANQTTTYSYDSVGQLIQVTNPLNETIRYVYDGLGYLTQIINANNQLAASLPMTGSGASLLVPIRKGIR